MTPSEEIAALKHDIERHIKITSEQQAEIEQLRATLRDREGEIAYLRSEE